MEELLVKEEPITAETAETASFYISNNEVDSDSVFSSVCDDESTDSDIIFNGKLTLLEISPGITLSNIVNNIVSQY